MNANNHFICVFILYYTLSIKVLCSKIWVSDNLTLRSLHKIINWLNSSDIWGVWLIDWFIDEENKGEDDETVNESE